MTSAGLAAEFVDADDLMVAIQKLRDQGYRELDAFSPHPIEGLDEVLSLGRSRLNWMVFPLGMGGAIGAFFIQVYCNAWSYPINVGGRPPFAWVSNIPITFETGILAAAFSVFIGLFWVIGLPNLTHPLFKVDGFERATLDRYWLAVDWTEPRFDRARTAEELRRLGAVRVAPFGQYAERSP
jgi:hypothetical protein